MTTETPVPEPERSAAPGGQPEQRRALVREQLAWACGVHVYQTWKASKPLRRRPGILWRRFDDIASGQDKEAANMLFARLICAFGFGEKRQSDFILAMSRALDAEAREQRLRLARLLVEPLWRRPQWNGTRWNGMPWRWLEQ
jgi:hypothetical protein